MTYLPEHLGGHAGKTHLFPEVLDFLVNRYNIKTMVDVGCGPAGMVELARSSGLDCIGIDGDWVVPRNIEVVIHDFTTGPYNIEPRDLAWSVEFLEHVEEQYMDNYFQIFKQCRIVVCTAAIPGQDGHHHVNCQDEEYWIRKFEERGFLYEKEATEEMRSLDYKKKKDFIRKTGRIFSNTR